MDTTKNDFGFKTSISEKDLQDGKYKIENDKPDNKYRANLPNEGTSFKNEDYIKLIVKGYNKEVNLKTFCSYNTDKPKAAIYLFHGLGSFSDHSTGLAKFLADSDYFVCSIDLREHGYSDGELGYIYSLDDAINDSFKFVKLTEEFTEKKFNCVLPKFIAGISMGGMISNYVSRQINFNGVIYFAPCFNIDMGSFFKYSVSIFSFFYPTKKLPGFPETISTVVKNPVFTEKRCPISEKRGPTVGTVNALFSKCKDFNNKGNKSHENSALFIVAGVDKCVSNKSILDYYNSSKVKDKTMWYYPNMWHFIYFEEEMEHILPNLKNWIDQRIK